MVVVEGREVCGVDYRRAGFLCGFAEVEADRFEINSPHLYATRLTPLIPSQQSQGRPLLASMIDFASSSWRW